MMAESRNWQWRSLGLAAAWLLLATTLYAAERGARLTKTGRYNPANETVEMFAAIEKGDIAVKLIPKDSTQCRVLIENKTSSPLNVRLPDAFAGVPVLAQVDGGRRSTGGSSNQSFGGGMGGMGGMGGGMGMFNVAPEKVGQFKITTVCLEHGKPNPRAAIPYEIKPLESFTTKPGVRELCESLGKGQVNQRAAQVAAWHLNDGLSWQELAAKRIRHANGTSEPYFSPSEIQGGVNIASAAVKLSEERRTQDARTPTSPGVK